MFFTSYNGLSLQTYNAWNPKLIAQKVEGGSRPSPRRDVTRRSFVESKSLAEKEGADARALLGSK